MRRNLRLGDRRRHRPGRVEIDAGDLRRQCRRRLFGLADDDAIAPHHLVILDRLGEGRGDVDHHIARAERKIHVGEALERGFELPDPLVHGDVERGNRPRRHGAGRCEAVAQLEALDCVGERVVIGARGLVGGEIGADDQALSQQLVMGTLHAQCDFGVGGDRRPAAAHRDVRIAQRGFADTLRASFVVGRLMRERERCRGA